MTTKTRLETVASALYAVGRPDVLADTINTGLNGNRRSRAVVEDGVVQILRRAKGETDFSPFAQISREGAVEILGGGRRADKFAAHLNSAIPMSAVESVESYAKPRISEISAGLRHAHARLDAQPLGKSRLGQIGVYKDVDSNAHALAHLSRFIPLTRIAEEMTKFFPAPVFVRAEEKALSLQDGDGIVLAHIGPRSDPGDKVSITGQEAINAAFRAAIVSLDAEMDLTLRVAETRKAAKAEAQARWKAELDALGRTETERAQKFLDGLSVRAGDVFVLVRDDYHEDHGRVEIRETLIAERDLTAEDIADVLEFRRDGLARPVGGKELHLNISDTDRIREALARVRGEDTPSPE